MAGNQKLYGDLKCKKGDHLILQGSGEEDDIDVKSMHVSCRSDKFSKDEDFIGMVLYKYQGQTKWTLNRVRCQAGYIFFTKSSGLNGLPGKTMHAKAFYKLFGVELPEGQLVSSGFSFQNGEWKQKSTTFNAKQTAYTNVNQREGVTEFSLVQKAITGYALGQGQNFETTGWTPPDVTNTKDTFGGLHL